LKLHSKNKGNSFERDIASLLTEVTGSKWYRVPTSGAFATLSGTTDVRFQGDVYTDDENYKDVVVECKSYATLEVNELFNKNSKFWGWIEQSKTESKGKDWVLFIKINRKGLFMVSEIDCNLPLDYITYKISKDCKRIFIETGIMMEKIK